MSRNARPFLEVADRGPGVAPEHAERIFEPFYSGGRGTGLGLFLARELAQTNGATLLYEPRAGRRQHLPAGVRGSAPVGGLMSETAVSSAAAPSSRSC